MFPFGLNGVLLEKLKQRVIDITRPANDTPLTDAIGEK